MSYSRSEEKDMNEFLLNNNAISIDYDILNNDTEEASNGNYSPPVVRVLPTFRAYEFLSRSLIPSAIPYNAEEKMQSIRVQRSEPVVVAEPDAQQAAPARLVEAPRAAVELAAQRTKKSFVLNTLKAALLLEAAWINTLLLYDYHCYRTEENQRYGHTLRGIFTGYRDVAEFYPYPNAIADHFWAERPDKNVEFFAGVTTTICAPIILGFGIAYTIEQYKKNAVGENNDSPMMKKIKNSLLYLSYLGYLDGVLSYARTISTFANKKDIYNSYRNDKKACDNTYSYLNAIAKFACNICGDWDDVTINLKDINDPQSCLNALLSASIDPEVIYERLDRLKKFTGYKTVDLSKQDYEKWSETNFKKIFQQLNAMQFNLSLFDISKKIGTSVALSRPIVETITNFLQSNPARIINMKGLIYGSGYQTTLFPGLHNQSIENLILTSAKLDNAGPISLGDALAGGANIKRIEVANNGIIDLAASHIVDNCESVTSIDLDGNPLTGLTLQRMGNSKCSSQLQKLSIASWKSLSDKGLQYLRNFTSLAELTVSNNNLQEDGVVIFSQSIPLTLKILNFANNDLSSKVAASVFFESLPSGLEYLDISKTGLHTYGVDAFVKFIVNSNIKTLVITEIAPTISEFRKIMEGVFSSSVIYLDLSSNQLTDEYVDVINELLLKNKNRLVTIVLSNNVITDKSGCKLIETFAIAGIESFNVAGNKLTNKVAYVLADTIPSSHFVKVDISDNPMDGDGVYAVVKAGKLKELAVDHIPVNDNNAEDIAKSLLSSSYDLSFISKEKLSSIETRVLRQATPGTSLKTLSLNQCGLTSEAKRILSLVLPSANLTIENVSMADDAMPSTVFLPSVPFFESSIMRLNATRLEGRTERNDAINDSFMLQLSAGMLFLLLIFQLIKKSCRQTHSTTVALAQNGIFAEKNKKNYVNDSQAQFQLKIKIQK